MSKLKKQSMSPVPAPKPASSVTVRKAETLSPEHRSAVESLLGRRVFDGEVVSIRAIVPSVLSEERKEELLQQLKKYFAEVDAQQEPVSQEEAEDIVNDAMRSVRPGYRPHQ